MFITEAQFKRIFYANPLKAVELTAFVAMLNTIAPKTMSVLERAHFLAQLAHESNQLKWTQERPSAASGKNFEAYDFRPRLGNTQPGDGAKFCGRGFIQITGRANYMACGKALNLDLTSTPELLAQMPHAFTSALWYWNTHGLPQAALADDVEKVTKLINGGHNGLDDRKKYLALAKQAYGI